MELTVQTASDQTFVDVAREWLRCGLEDTLGELHAELATDVELSASATEDESDPWGPPNALWAGMDISNSAARSGRVRSYSNQAWKKFLADISKCPNRAGVEIQRLDDRGRPGHGAGHIRVKHLRNAPDWCGFELAATDDLVRWQSSGELQNQWISALKNQAESTQCTFASISDDSAQGRTALEMALGLAESDSARRGRDVLRGYSWVTVCGPEAAKRLGGAERLRKTGAFREVDELSYGGLLLRATETYAEYTEDQVRRVFEALAPALPPGVAEPIYGYEHLKLVYGLDAADRR